MGKFRPVRIIVLGFLSIILLGTVLLSLPIAYRGERLSVLDTVFTVTSATCVTGLVVVDTAQHWTGFGQAVLLSLIQIGGLGFMAILTLFSLLFKRRITLKERVVISESLSGVDIGGIVRLMKRILFGTLFFELGGAILLSVCFVPEFGIGEGIWKSIFISVSAFCNAGFDILGDAHGAFSSLAPYANDVLVNLVVCTLIIMGGLGFLVWGKPRSRHMSLHTKLVLITTGILVFVPFAAFYFFEQQNPLTLGPMPTGEKLLAAFFQSVTTRTAGFNTISNGDLTVPSKLLTMALMFIGGSPASTAGGIKTVTIAVALCGAVSAFRGRADTNVFRRRIPKMLVLRAMSIVILAFLVAMVSAVFLLCAGGADPMNLMFEVFSAFGTVGLGTGVTPLLPPISKMLLILLMFTGRIGFMSFVIALFMREEKVDSIRFPEEIVLLG